ncbi:MAG: DUF4339 domain-containing protein [Armatimonadetes bacterium]|nr:DUF4339 domain-containing protein [Armatimonadota bacterium]
MKYYVMDGEKADGPFTLAELQAMAAAGLVKPDTRLRPEDLGPEVPAQVVQGVFIAPDAAFATPPSQTKPGRNPYVIALVVLVGLCVVCLPVVGAVLFPVFSQARIAAQRSASLGNVRQLLVATLTYVADHDDHFPPAMGSADEARPFIEKYVVGVTDKDKLDFLFQTMNERSHTWRGNETLAAADATKLTLPQLTLVFFDSQDWPGGKRCVGLADGSAKVLAGDSVFRAHEANKGVLGPNDLATGTSSQ